MRFKQASAFFINVCIAVFLAVTVTNCNLVQKQARTVSVVESPSPDNKLIAKVFIDDKFSGLERESITEGVKEWERATDGTVRFNILPRGTWNVNDRLLTVPKPDSATHITHCSKDIYIVRAFSKDKLVTSIESAIKEQTGEKIVLAGYTNSSCQVKWILIVADRIETEDVYVEVTVHEMGHMLGLRHVTLQEMTCMYPSLEYSTKCVTQLDTEQFCNIWKCDPEKMIPCMF